MFETLLALFSQSMPLLIAGVFIFWFVWVLCALFAVMLLKFLFLFCSKIMRYEREEHKSFMKLVKLNSTNSIFYLMLGPFGFGIVVSLWFLLFMVLLVEPVWAYLRK